MTKPKQDFDLAEKLYERVRWGGVLYLVSNDDNNGRQVKIDVKIECYAGVKGMAVKFAGDKKFLKSYIYSPSDIINYLSQFHERGL